jgi:hypothetical protein
MQVLTLPPKLSYNSLVSLLSRYGTCEDFPSTKAVITFIKADKLRLIFVASLNLKPIVPVFFYFSEPAKSTKFSLPILIICFDP